LNWSAQAPSLLAWLDRRGGAVDDYAGVRAVSAG